MDFYLQLFPSHTYVQYIHIISSINTARNFYNHFRAYAQFSHSKNLPFFILVIIFYLYEIGTGKYKVLIQYELCIVWAFSQRGLIWIITNYICIRMRNKHFLKKNICEQVFLRCANQLWSLSIYERSASFGVRSGIFLFSSKYFFSPIIRVYKNKCIQKTFYIFIFIEISASACLHLYFTRA